jgi:hypothetical protein
MPCSVEGGEELGMSGRRRCGQPWEEKWRLEVVGETDEWDRGVGDWERGREEGGPAGVGWAGNCRWAAEEGKKKKGGEVGRGKLGSNRKGRERFWRFGFLLFFSFLSFLNTHQPNKSNQNNATHIHIYLIYKYKQLPFSYTKFPVKRIIVGKILNYEKIVD